jgi:hypothetical protein
MGIDRLLSIAAIVIGLGALIRVEYLFEILYRLEQYIKNVILNEFITTLHSYSAFARAIQFVEMNPMDLTKDSAFALFTVFELQKRRYPDGRSEEMNALRKKTRDEVETAARGYAEMLVKSGQGKLKDGFGFK